MFLFWAFFCFSFSHQRLIDRIKSWIIRDSFGLQCIANYYKDSFAPPLSHLVSRPNDAQHCECTRTNRICSRLLISVANIQRQQRKKRERTFFPLPTVCWHSDSCSRKHSAPSLGLFIFCCCALLMRSRRTHDHPHGASALSVVALRKQDTEREWVWMFYTSPPPPYVRVAIVWTDRVWRLSRGALDCLWTGRLLAGTVTVWQWMRTDARVVVCGSL